MDITVLRLLVLDELYPNLQSIHTIIGPCWYADQRQIAEAIVSGIADGLIDAKVYDHPSQSYRIATPQPSVREIEQDAEGDEPAEYWFDLTPAGRRALRDGREALVAFLEANPLGEGVDD